MRPLRLRGDLLPPGGAPVHVNRPLHDGHVPLHGHDFVEIALVAGGHAAHRTIHGVEPIAVGDVLVVAPGHWHAYEGAQGLRLANCNLGPDLLLGPLAWVGEDPAVARLIDTEAPPGRRAHLDGEVLAAALAVFDAIRRAQDEPARRRIAVLGLLVQALGLLAEGVDLAAPSERGGRHPVVELAAIAGVDRSYLVRLFRRHAGMPPLAWLARVRAERAAVLLMTTDQPIAAIGVQVGWADPNYFARRFRAILRQTPTDYRGRLPVPPQQVPVDAWIQW
jgi:AraC family L-rhamnose operon transcriptional activator RhaR